VHLVTEENAIGENVTEENTDKAAETEESATGQAVNLTTRGRRYGLIGLAVLGLVVGVAGSWIYNSGYKTRAANNSAVIRSAADPSTYVTPGNFTELTVPIRNDSPDAVTVVGLTLPDASRILWDGKQTVIPAGSTAYLHVKTPSSCAAIPHPLTSASSVSVTLRVTTANGKPHGGLRAAVSGVIEYAADYCASPSPSTTKG
jgi:hypothetical protein